MDVLLFRTRYPHWGRHSGIQQFVRFLNAQQYRFEVRLVADGDQDFPLRSRWVRATLLRAAQKGGMRYYRLSDLYAELTAMRRCGLGGPAVVHFLDGEHTAQYLPVFARRWPFTSARTVATYHQPPELLKQLLDVGKLRWLHHVSLVSETQRAFFARFVPEARISVIPHGIDTEFFRPAARNRSRTVFRTITVGHWLRDWHAMRRVAERIPRNADIELHVVTDRSTGLEEQPNVVIHRSVSDLRLRRLYQLADVLLLPLSSATANNALLEGIACGLPVVSTRLDAIREYLPPEAAILVRDNDADLFVDALLQLQANTEMRVAMGEAARLRAENLSWSRIAPLYDRMYQSL